MVVDDMSTSRALIVQALEEIGIRNVSTASGGVEAIGALTVSPVHLVISDFNMPGIDGLGLLEKLRMSPTTSRIGFIIVTGRMDSAMVSKGQKLNLNNIISKPFSVVDMRACIEKVVGRL
jgi:two-component system, chemotaxis family, chemotaxis protein CheY